MILEYPMGAKITTLFVTRLLLLAGAGVIHRRTPGLQSVGLLVGSSALVVSCLATFCLIVGVGAFWGMPNITPICLIVGVGPFRGMPNITPIVQTLEIGGWICFAVSFLLQAVGRRKGTQNQALHATSEPAPGAASSSHEG